MEIIVGKTAGFCFGVKNAVTKAIEETNKTEEIYCLGELVHNKQVTNNLIEKGIKFIEDIEQVRKNVIIRSHGASKEIYQKANSKGLNVIDLTCPKVLKTHQIAEEYANKNYYIFLTGDKKHPEIIATASFCGKDYTVIENEEEIEQAISNYKKSNKKNALLMSQTTYSLEKFKKIAEEITKAIGEENLEIKNTICNATKERQEETKELSKEVELMIIVGGKHSSNSNKLYELAKQECSKVLFIETEEELKNEEIKGVKKVGIMAGASTPAESIEKVIEKLGKI